MILNFGDGSKTGKKSSVEQLQKALLALGYNPGVIDGEYGNNTAAAVAMFQTDYGLSPTGNTDDKTYSFIQQAVTGQISKTSRTTTLPPSLSFLDQQFLGVKALYWILGGVVLFFYVGAKK